MTAFILGYAFGFSVGMAFLVILWDSEAYTMLKRLRGSGDEDAVVGGSRPSSRSL